MKKGKALLSSLLSAALIAGMLSVPVHADQARDVTNASPVFADMPDNWSTPALRHAAENGLLTGFEGKIRPQSPMTRAEMSTIVVRAFGATVVGDLSAFTDVDASDWYSAPIAKAYQMQVINGSQGNMRPNDTITREEVFAIMARALKLRPMEASGRVFGDGSEVSRWARGEVNALVKAGYVQGADGRLNPKAKMTRAEFAQMMDNIIKVYVQSASVVQTLEAGNVMVNAPGVELKDVTVNGDLIIGDGVGNGEVTLDNVNITGRLVVRGGGEHSIIIKGHSSASNVIVARIDGIVSVKVLDNANVGIVYVEDGSDDVIVEGSVGKIEVLAPDVTVMAVEADVRDVEITGEKSVVILKRNTTVGRIHIHPSAVGARVEVFGKVDVIDTSAEATEITGDGNVAEVNVLSGADRTKIVTPKTVIRAARDVVGVTGGGGAEIKAGATETNNDNGSDIVRPYAGPAPDTSAPVIVLNGAATVHVEHGSTYTDAGVTVTDNRDTGLTAVVTYTLDDTPAGSIDTTIPGTYTVHYNARDAAGNAAIEVTREVVVAEAVPAITAITPTAGPSSGGTTVTITGTNLTGASAVTFGGEPATSFTVDSAARITATTPALSAGIVDIAVTTNGGTTTLTNGYTYVAAPTITSLSATEGPASGGPSVTITGTNLSEATAVMFGETAAAITANTATTITVNTPAHSAGTADVTVSTIGGSATLTNGYTYVAAPTISSILPTAGSTNGGVTVTIIGTSFTDATAVTFGGTSATSFIVDSATQIRATSPAGSAGAVDVAVTTIGGTGTLNNGHTYVAAPTITSLSSTEGPTSGSTSDSMTISIIGTNLTGATAVMFGGTSSTSFTVDSATQITTTIPAGSAGAVDVSVTTVGGTATLINGYTYVAAPTITSLDVTAGPLSGGTTVTITGTNLAGATAVTFGLTATSFIVDSDNQITVTTPAHTAGVVNVAVTTIGGTGTLNNGYTYAALPTISSLSATTGPRAGGSSVTIYGANLSGATEVMFGATTAAIAANTATSITVTTPAHVAGTVDVSVTTAGGAAMLTSSYTFVAAPMINPPLSVTMGPVSGGTTVTITGTNLSGATAVMFGTTSAAIITNTNTSITVTTPAHVAGAVNVSVTTIGGTGTLVNGFVYAAAPTITSLSSTEGPLSGGTIVTINGTGFTYATAVMFGGTPATSVTLNMSTQITATIPAGSAGAVNVSVTTIGGTATLNNGYTYVAPPTITAISPNNGTTSGGTTVTITGTNLARATTVMFGGMTGAIISRTDTQIIVTTPAIPAGQVDVTVTTSGGSATISNGYFYSFDNPIP